jgi:hypothetical protein
MDSIVEDAVRSKQKRGSSVINRGRVKRQKQLFQRFRTSSPKPKHANCTVRRGRPPGRIRGSNRGRGTSIPLAVIVNAVLANQRSGTHIQRPPCTPVARERPLPDVPAPELQAGDPVRR